jgi:HAD superfamily hydrolase (TIGR01509 family)
MKLPKAFIFDMDGTMINSEPYMQKARANLFTQFGVPLSYEQNIRTGTHKSIYWSDLKNTYSLSLSVDELIDIEQSEAAELMKKENAAPANGLIELLEFAKASGIKIGCASSSIKSYVVTLMKHLKIDGYFTAIVGGDDDIEHKPAPTPYLTVCKALGVEPSECVAFEDSYLGSLSPVNAGIPCVGFNGYTKSDLSNCFVVTNDYKDIIKIFS